MENPTRQSAEPDQAAVEDTAADVANVRLSTLSSLLLTLDETPSTLRSAVEDASLGHQNQLVQVRLGVASSLFVALRAKHQPTAAHCLRVALGCSSWAHAHGLQDEERDEIEVGALLHDIGKIGVPDNVLMKPGKLSAEEQAAIDQHRQLGVQILMGCSSSKGILDIVQYSSAWYNGSRTGFDRAGTDIPLGARIVAIIDAFDAMTTDHVYRRAMSRERAVSELYQCAGTQFDPNLINEFCELLTGDIVSLNSEVARHWLKDLRKEDSNRFWQLFELSRADVKASDLDTLFHRKLLDSMHDGVIFVDTHLRVLLWNRAAERLTGLAAGSVHMSEWSPHLIGLHTDTDERIDVEQCPLAESLRTGCQDLRRFVIVGRGGAKIPVDAHMVPVMGRNGVTYGATLLLHDASPETSLEERVQTLHVKATRDPLTQVANRAEFDRVHTQFVETHLETGLPCSLIICDLDHFKNINDKYGHQAGDEALVSFAALLRRSCRTGDLVARYGGEEFVMLCTDCDNASGTQRAEEIRQELANIEQSMLNGKCITASFGVTEIQPGDTPETMLRRADRGLLQAKSYGRNRVVQLGSGSRMVEVTRSSTRTRWLSGWFQPRSGQPIELLTKSVITAVPLNVAAEKLRGFVADHHALILEVDGNRISLRIDGENTPMTRRGSDRPVPFFITLSFEETIITEKGGQVVRTVVHVAIRPKRHRDRRRADAKDRAERLLNSLKSYLMAQNYQPSPEDTDAKEGGALKKRAKQIFGPLVGRKTGDQDDSP